MNNVGHYAQLELGARHLAAISEDAEERRMHLGWANRYYRLKTEALQVGQPFIAATGV